MARSPAPGKIALYLSLIGLAAMVPIAVNRYEGWMISVVAVLFVAVFIWSDIRADRKRP